MSTLIGILVPLLFVGGIVTATRVVATWTRRGRFVLPRTSLEDQLGRPAQLWSSSLGWHA